MLYLDTSALLKLYVREAGSRWVQEQVASQYDPLPIWELQEAELVNALHLKVFWKEITEGQVQDQLALFQSRKKRGLYVFPSLERSQLMDRFRSFSRHTMDLGTRTLDVLHVACACEVGAETFLSFDKRQNVLAERVGLWVPKPNEE